MLIVCIFKPNGHFNLDKVLNIFLPANQFFNVS